MGSCGSRDETGHLELRAFTQVAQEVSYVYTRPEECPGRVRLMPPQRELHAQSCGREGLASLGTEEEDSVTTRALGGSWTVCKAEAEDRRWRWSRRSTLEFSFNPQRNGCICY